MRKLYFLSLIIFVLTISCTDQKQDAVRAGLEFCSCLKENVNKGKELARNKCYGVVNNMYPLLKIYFETRDTNISDLYNQETIESVFEFVDKFCRKVDSCNPPFWFKAPNDPSAF